VHLQGPSVIKKVTANIKEALNTGKYTYAIRLDIKSYYASINHKILLQQLAAVFDDPMLLRYLNDIVTIPIDNSGNLELPTSGIPIRSSLSPFFGALYLKPLDEAFAKRDCFYIRYMDDIVILLSSKRQYTKARKQLFAILQKLRLKISPHKTQMGKLRNFHFLGVAIEEPQALRSKIQINADIHSRTCQRALDKVALSHHAVNPATIQRYLSRWALWWTSVVKLDTIHLLDRWTRYCSLREYSLMLYGLGLLLGTEEYGEYRGAAGYCNDKLPQ